MISKANNFLLLLVVFLFLPPVFLANERIPKRRALLVGIGNYVKKDYVNAFHKMPEINEALLRFNKVCSSSYQECQLFLENPHRAYKEQRESLNKAFRDFYEVVEENDTDKSLLRIDNWLPDFVLYQRDVYDAKSINLNDGPHNDVFNVARILSVKYDFDEIFILLDENTVSFETIRGKIRNIGDGNTKTKFILLNDEKHLPTTDGIKKVFEEYLTKRAAPCQRKLNIVDNCDRSIFYYSGHGSQRKNPFDLNERDAGTGGSRLPRLDETLVTLDVAEGKPDLRDDELARLYNEALKKTNLTVITDSCHSGDNFKNPLGTSLPKTINNDPRPVTESDYQNKDDSPIKNGLIFFGASQENQTAESKFELEDLFGSGDQNRQQGVFTHYFVKTLISVNDAGALEVFERTKSVLKGEKQSPVVEGEQIARVNFFGDKIENVFEISEVIGDKIYIKGGRLDGLSNGIKMKNDSMCFEIKETDWQKSRVEFCKDSKQTSLIGLKGKRLKQASWLVPSENALKFWFSVAPQGEIEKISKKVEKNAVSDFSKEVSHLIYYEDRQWHLCKSGDRVCLPASIETLNFSADDKVFLIRPIPDEIKSSLGREIEEKNFSVKLVKSFKDANYFLFGGADGKYSWANFQGLNWKKDPLPLSVPPAASSLSLPVLTRFATLKTNDNETSELAELAQDLGRMYSWVTLKFFSPAENETFETIKLLVDNSPFPQKTPVPKGSFLKINVAQPKTAKFYYLISFDKNGAMNFENEKESPRDCIQNNCTIEEIPTVDDKLQDKILVLLSTDKKIEGAKWLFTKESVKSPGSNSLNLLLSQMQSGQKNSSQPPIIENWSINVFTVKVAGKKL